jgi:hypothetical protein
MNKEKKLYSQLLNLEMEKEEVLQVIEKFYSEWKSYEEIYKFHDIVFNYIKKEQFENKVDFISKKQIFENLIDIEEPICTPNELEEIILELINCGSIYEPRKDCYRIMGRKNK